MRADLDLVFEKKNVGHTETSKTLLRMMAGVEGGGGLVEKWYIKSHNRTKCY